jgi:hypothetical protein
MSSRAAAAIVLAAVVLSASAAAADDTIQVTVTPNGATWSVGGRGGAPCSPSCTMFVAPDKYVVVMNEVRETIPILVPAEITYHPGVPPGVPKLRTIGGWTAVGGVGVGGVLLGFGAYGYMESCKGGCPSLNISRPAAGALVVSASALISVSVAGAILFAVSGESISVRELAPVPDPPRSKSFDVMLAPSAGGAAVGIAARF